jgi:hypothetical protein
MDSDYQTIISPSVGTLGIPVRGQKAKERHLDHDKKTGPGTLSWACLELTGFRPWSRTSRLADWMASTRPCRCVIGLLLFYAGPPAFGDPTDRSIIWDYPPSKTAGVGSGNFHIWLRTFSLTISTPFVAGGPRYWWATVHPPNLFYHTRFGPNTRGRFQETVIWNLHTS